MTVRIAMWSGPRNISTAMLRSWENRNDTQVVDEPFYACYLALTRSPHPGFDQILAAQSHDYAEVAHTLSQAPCPSPIFYQKLMTHHMLPGVDLAWTKSMLHCFLIRDPAQVVNSYTNSRGVCNAEDIGIARQAELYQQITAITGKHIPVIDSNDVLRAPRSLLSQLCERLNICFDEAMLSWPKGKRQSDGVWAEHWYKNVEQSTGFAPYQDKPLQLSKQQQAVVDQVYPYFASLYQKRLRP